MKTTKKADAKTRVTLHVDVTPRQLKHLMTHMRMLRIPFSTSAIRDVDTTLQERAPHGHHD